MVESHIAVLEKKKDGSIYARLYCVGLIDSYLMSVLHREKLCYNYNTISIHASYRHTNPDHPNYDTIIDKLIPITQLKVIKLMVSEENTRREESMDKIGG